MTVHIIVDPRRPEKFEAMCDELNRQRIADYIIVEAVMDRKTVEASINASHKFIVQNAKELGLPEVCVFEDDCEFTSATGFHVFQDSKPKEFDLYLGGCYSLNQLAINRINESDEPAVEINNFTGMHCYIMHERYYDRFLALPDTAHIDVVQAGLGNFFVCNPMVAYQRPGWSATSNKIVDYNVNNRK